MPDKIISELIDTIENGVNDFNESIPAIQKKILARLIDLSKEFYIPAKTIKQQADNLKLISKIKGEIESIVLSKEYKENIKEFIIYFTNIEKIQNKYFATLNTEFNPSALLDQIKKTNIDLTVDKLTENGLGANVTDKVRDILNRNITTGAKYSDLISEMSEFLTDTEKKLGALSRYTKQITNDSLNVYSAQYTKAVTDDLGLMWYAYVGSNVAHTRPFCLALIKAKQDCMPYIHKLELDEVAKGHICGDVVSLAGLIPGTDGNNLQINRGGYNCGHQLMPVSEAIVPKEVRIRVYEFYRILYDADGYAIAA